MNLTQTNPNKKYIITGITGNSPLSRRLIVMGFTAGSYVQTAGRAPFGGTTLIVLRGQLIALRDNAAENIIVEPLL